MIIKRIKLFLFGCFILFFPQIGIGDTTGASLLLQSFGGQCPTVVTRSISQSMAHIESMKSIVQDLKASEECSGISNISHLLREYGNVYEQYMVYEQFQHDRLDLEKQVAWYTNLLTDPLITPERSLFLKDEIFRAQSSLMAIETDQKRFDNNTNKFASASSGLLTGIEDLVRSVDQYQQCFSSRSPLISTLVSQGLMTASSYLRPGEALGAATAGVAVQVVGTVLYNLKFNRTLRELDELQLVLALQCTSEVLSTSYCQAQDTIRVIEKREDDFGSRDPDFAGFNLLSEELGRLNHWLKEVYAGSEITSEGDLINREKPILQYELLQRIFRYVETYGVVYGNEIAQYSSGSRKSFAIAKGIDNLVTVMSFPTLQPENFGGRPPTGDVTNPLFTTLDRLLLPFQLFRPDLNERPACNAPHRCLSMAQWATEGNLILNLGDWNNAVTRAKDLLSDEIGRLAISRSRAVAIDAYSILVSSTRLFNGNTNAIKGLDAISDNADRIQRYLTDTGCVDDPQTCTRDQFGHKTATFRHKYFGQIYNTKRTKDLTTTILNLIEEGLIPRTTPEEFYPAQCRQEELESNRPSFDPVQDKGFRILNCISTLLHLNERGNEAYFRKIRDMVAYEIEARFFTGGIENDIEDIVYETRDDLVLALYDIFAHSQPEIGLNAYLESLDSTKFYVSHSLEQLFDFYEKKIKDILDNDEISQTEINKFCFRILPHLTENSSLFNRKAYSACKNAKLESRLNNGPVVYWKQFLSRASSITGVRVPRNSLENRMCAYYSYQRENRLVEILRDRN